MKKNNTPFRVSFILAVILLNGLPVVCRSQNVWNVCTGNTYEYAYCVLYPSSSNCNTCTVEYIGGDATGYTITRGDYNGAYTTTITWLKAGTYSVYYACELPNSHTVTVGQAETQYPVAGSGVLCGGSRSIQISNSESGLLYRLIKNNVPYGSYHYGSAGSALTWDVTDAGTYNVVAVYGCTYVSTNQPAVLGTAVVTAPATYTVAGGGSYCPGGGGLSVTLAGSQNGVSYELYKDGALVPGSTQTGTGGGLSWSNLTGIGTYTVKALGDCGARWDMSGQAPITSGLPTAFSLGGGGSYCSGGNGLPVTLSGSQAGVSYQLKNNGADTGAAIAGTGNPITWSNQTAAGVYTVEASSSCQVAMSGNATISVLPLLPGATMANAINIGDNLSCITYTNQQTIAAGNCFRADIGTGGDDIFYKFTVSTPSSLSASHCGTGFNTTIYLLNSGGSVISSLAVNAAINCEEGSDLAASIAPGTYYVVSKVATSANQGSLITAINLENTAEYYLSPPAATLLEDQSVVLTVPEEMTTVSTWSPLDNTIESVTEFTATVRPGETTVYQAQGIINGCAATAEATITVQPDDSDHNFVKETMSLVPGMKSLSDLESLSVDGKNVRSTYFDGLGRTSQVVSWQASPDKKDIVQPIVYDAYGRQPVKYLPYTSHSSSGQFKASPLGTPGNYPSSAQSAFYKAGNDAVADDPQPYSRTVFEASPLNSILKQGAAGAAWQPDPDPSNSTDKAIKKRHEINLPDEVLHFHQNTSSGLALAYNKYYAAGQLTVDITTDEHGYEVKEYIDKEGRVVLKKVEYKSTEGTRMFACTYYIYNDMGDLAVVLPPEAVKLLTECYYAGND